MIVLQKLTNYLTKLVDYLHLLVFKMEIKANVEGKIHGLKTYGKVKVKTNKSAKIVLGSDIVFRSRMFSNYMGINRSCSIAMMKDSAKLEIGQATGFSGTAIGCFENIKIGRNVMFGANTLVTDSDWHEDDFRSGGSRPVLICDNVWIGYGAIILKGVEIGENSVIGAGSIVTSSIPANVVAAGNPCRIVKHLSRSK